MAIKIESNIPLAPRGRGGRGLGEVQTALQSLEKGQSILLSENEHTHGNVSKHAYVAKQTTGHTYTMRTVDGGYRIWRTA